MDHLVKVKHHKWSWTKHQRLRAIKETGGGKKANHILRCDLAQRTNTESKGLSTGQYLVVGGQFYLQSGNLRQSI
ncbi:hypothetical protein TYRP_003338 [Tyrophagus putrescentiae]|nr:hypothetical protein TYRP_003338 [Tyrophagus putrescentiae]